MHPSNNSSIPLPTLPSFLPFYLLFFFPSSLPFIHSSTRPCTQPPTHSPICPSIYKYCLSIYYLLNGYHVANSAECCGCNRLCLWLSRADSLVKSGKTRAQIASKINAVCQGRQFSRVVKSLGLQTQPASIWMVDLLLTNSAMILNNWINLPVMISTKGYHSAINDTIIIKHLG